LLLLMPAILFVCTANRIRSPLAEYLCRARLNELAPEQAFEWRIESAGAWAQAGLPATQNAIAVARQAGIDLTRHVSRPVELIAFGEFDLVLTMEEGQRDALRAEHPQRHQQIRTLAEAAVGIAYDVADPIGQPLEQYAATLREIDTLLARALPRMLKVFAAPAPATT
jgi:protein-tyrosine-phosphatase